MRGRRLAGPGWGPDAGQGHPGIGVVKSPYFAAFFGPAKQAAEKGLDEGEFEYWPLLGLKPDVDLIGFMGLTEVMPFYKASRNGALASFSAVCEVGALLRKNQGIGRRLFGFGARGFAGGFGGEEFFPVADDLGALFLWQGEDGFGARGEFLIDQGVGAGELVLDLAGTEDVPALEGDPEVLGGVGGGAHAFDLQQLVEALGAAVEGEDADAAAVEVGGGEHFAADVAVADPVDEVVSPADGFSDVGKGEADFANALVIHGESLKQLRFTCLRG